MSKQRKLDLFFKKPREISESITADNAEEPIPSTSGVIINTNISISQQNVMSPSPEAKRKKMSPEAKRKKMKHRKYDPSYLAFGFTYKDDVPQCVICFEILTNSAMVPAKLKRHLETNHQQYRNKSIDFFKRKESELKTQKTMIRNTGIGNELALKVSFLISLRIAKSKKNFTIGEELIMPCMLDAAHTLLGDKAASKIKTIPLSNDTVSNRINMMSEDIHQQLLKKIKLSKIFALQLDESTDIVDKALLLIYVRYVDWDEKEIKEEFMNCLELKKHTTGTEIFSVLSGYLLSADLKLSDCISICTDGAANMIGRHAGLVAQMKEVAPEIQGTHCMIHREMLASKKISAELNQVLATAVKTVNFIKSSALNSRLFAILCDEMGSKHKTLLLHAEVRWLSRGRILKRLCELKEEIIIFLTNKNCELVKYFKDIDWNMKLCYLADIFQLLNELNLSLQGAQKTMFDSYSKIEGQKKKINLWIQRIENNCFDMFSALMELMNEVREKNKDYNFTQIKLIIVNHLKMLLIQFEDYFPSNQDPREGFLWVLDPFNFISSTNILSTNEDDMLADLSSDATLKNLKKNSSLDKFWTNVHNEYDLLSEKALKVLLPFPSTYLCESGFSAVTATKTKYRNRLNLTPTLRLSLTNLTPHIDAICSRMQAHPSH